MRDYCLPGQSLLSLRPVGAGGGGGEALVGVALVDLAENSGQPDPAPPPWAPGGLQFTTGNLQGCPGQALGKSLSVSATQA